MDEAPLQVLVTLAKKIGLNEAIVLQQLHYLCIQSSFGKTIDGKKWIYNTYEEWQAGYFPFWSVRTVERTFHQLHTMALIETCQPEGRESRRKYYRLNEGMRERLWRGDIPDPAKLADSDDPANLAPSEPAKLAPSCAGASNRTKTTAKTTLGVSKEKKTPNPEHKLTIDLWMQHYLQRNKKDYPFTARDAKAVKSLLGYFKTSAAIMTFIKSVHSRSSEGYPLSNGETLYDLANNLPRLQAALAKKLGQKPEVRAGL